MSEAVLLMPELTAVQQIAIWLLPIPLLDGSRIVMSLLPLKQRLQLQKIEPYGFYILFILMLTGVLGWVLNPFLNGSLTFFHYLFNL